MAYTWKRGNRKDWSHEVKGFKIHGSLPTLTQIMDLDQEAKKFQLAYTEMLEEYADFMKKHPLPEVPEGDQEDYLKELAERPRFIFALKGLGSLETEPIIKLMLGTITELEGVQSEDGKPLIWADLSKEDRKQFLNVSMTPQDLIFIYNAITSAYLTHHS